MKTYTTWIIASLLMCICVVIFIAASPPAYGQDTPEGTEETVETPSDETPADEAPAQTPEEKEKAQQQVVALTTLFIIVILVVLFLVLFLVLTIRIRYRVDTKRIPTEYEDVFFMKKLEEEIEKEKGKGENRDKDSEEDS